MSVRLKQGLRSVEVERYADEDANPTDDLVVIEEPLEIRVSEDSLATTMRTPGHDEELALGFLLAEGVIESRADVGRAAHCGRPGEAGFGNVLDILPAPGVSLETGGTRRGTLTTAACGVCGRRSIEDLLERCSPIHDPIVVARSTVEAVTAGLRAAQPNFDRTGGVHAAGLFDSTGEVRVVREDVGRHNAVDKVLGRLLLDAAIPATGSILVVSGRSSFEIVQKASVARIPVVVSVSAPTSLAVDTARETNTTLVGFARGGSFNVYSAPERIC